MAYDQAPASDFTRAEKLPDALRRVLIAVNPMAGAGSRNDAAEQLWKELAARSLEPSLCSSLDELGQEVAEQQNAGQLRAVVAVGGDGTAAEVVNRTPPGTPIAVFPTGTENLLAGYIGMGNQPATVAETIAQGRTVLVRRRTGRPAAVPPFGGRRLRRRRRRAVARRPIGQHQPLVVRQTPLAVHS